MSDIYLVRHCAPTLAGIKPGNRKGHPRCGCLLGDHHLSEPEYIFVLDRSTATGGVQVLDTMFSDLVAALMG